MVIYILSFTLICLCCVIYLLYYLFFKEFLRTPLNSGNNQNPLLKTFPRKSCFERRSVSKQRKPITMVVAISRELCGMKLITNSQLYLCCVVTRHNHNRFQHLKHISYVLNVHRSISPVIRMYCILIYK